MIHPQEIPLVAFGGGPTIERLELDKVVPTSSFELLRKCEEAILAQEHRQLDTARRGEPKGQQPKGQKPEGQQEGLKA